MVVDRGFFPNPPPPPPFTDWSGRFFLLLPVKSPVFYDFLYIQPNKISLPLRKKYLFFSAYDFLKKFAKCPLGCFF